jgi:3-oxoacyl-(acyl-carrier-protein) synthase
MIDATVAYLESMLEAEGRHASPRHFARSVYSTAASLLAIHFRIHGPCETLAFDSGEDPVAGALAQAWRLIAADRCDRVAVVWAEQGSAIAHDLARLAAEQLHRREYKRYVGRELGWGAAALVVARVGVGTWRVAVGAEGEAKGAVRLALRGNPFAMDGAVDYLAGLLLRR